MCLSSLLKKKSSTDQIIQSSRKDRKLSKKHSLRCTKNLHHNKCKLQNCFFLFHFRCWNQMEPHAVSQETRSWWERELSDYCFGQWLASVWGRGKKKGRESERERGREGVNEGGRGRLLLPFERAEKVARCSFTGRLWGLEETQGSRASHQLPICHSLTALSNIAPSRLYQWSKTMKWQTSPPACLSTGTPGCAHTPLGPTLFFFPPCVFVMLFSTTGHIFFSPLCWLSWVLARCWISICLRGTFRGVNKGSGH